MKKIFLTIILTALLFTTLEPVGKRISADVPAVLITAIRFLLGGMVLLLPTIYIIRKQNLHITTAFLLKTAALGILQVCGAMVILQQAVHLSASPAVVAIVFSANSVFSILLAMPILKETIGKWHIIAFVLCLCGILVSADLSGGISITPVLLAGLAAVVFSLYAVLCKKVMTDIPGTVVTCFSFLFGGGILLLSQLVTGVNIGQFVNIQTLPTLLYLGIAVTGLGFWGYFKVLGDASAFHASLVFFIKPILTPFAVWLINGLSPGINVFIALVLVLTGSLIATKQQTVKKITASGEGYRNTEKAE